ncbi:aldo/keto reductase [Chitinasiproducens palmae]|uniref:Aldo/keto reductase n=1 Tax=Chitinasiproducens palmae TaxID=1770053 RepID=A0A1H2PII7_9BURK|nr:aldo/keto reductase [Chitinasiproducens palmae]SDV46098.1 Aldo/keto reductase [Chitinasiproducens palmae]
MTGIPTLRLNDDRAFPQLGLGVWRASNEEVGDAIAVALDAGYRSIDTAAIYGNEEGVGRGIAAANVPRDTLFVTTKVWNDRQGHDETLAACDESLHRLGLDYVDLYLIHWPVPSKDRFVETWRALIALRDAGKARSIGVSNFTETQLQRLIDETGVVPAVNQIELNPLMQQPALRAFHRAHGIITECWSPLTRGKAFEDPVLTRIATRHGKTAAQIILRWHMQHGLVAIPKSVTPARIRENVAVFDFALDDAEMREIDGLDRGQRDGPDPETFAG